MSKTDLAGRVDQLKVIDGECTIVADKFDIKTQDPTTMDNIKSTTTTTVNQFMQYLGQRDLERLTTLFAADVDWYIPGDVEKAEWLGRRNSREQVVEFYTTLWKQTEPVSAQIDKIFIDGEDAVITGEFSTRMLRTGRVFDSLFSILMKVQRGEIVRYRLLEDSYAVSVALDGQ